MPYFTTIIPVWNRRLLVERTIESVLRQTGLPTDVSHDPANEVIVVDDGSTDGTAAAVLARFGGAVRIVEQANCGPAAARNAGIRHATGRYVAFVDSDDLWFPWTLATYAAAIRAHGEPAFLMTVPLDFTDEAALPSAPAPLVTRSFVDYFATHRLGLFTGTSAFVVRRDALEAVGGFAGPSGEIWVLGEDIDLAMRLGSAAGFALVDSPPAFAYRVHAGSSWAILDRTFAGARFLISRERAGHYPGGASRRHDRLDLLTRHLRPIALTCLRAGRLRDAWHLYRETFRWHRQLRRTKFLFAFPLVALMSAASAALRRRPRVTRVAK
jgi:glycosyltransferase involved in cell wall biosynthesis